jgi:hypothetical protein
MLISHQKKFIFIHIYKNAGTSINDALMPYTFYNPTHSLIYKMCKKIRIPLPFALDPQPLPGHSTTSELIRVLGREKFDSYFSFAIVRNPWDWQVSLYSFVLRRPMHPQHDLTSRFKDFEEYLRWRCSEDVHFQKDFICAPDGSQLIDFIGRYENLDREFTAICEHIGIRASLPILNVSKTRPYQDYYTPETIDLVRQTFAPDIDMFGYDFE